MTTTIHSNPLANLVNAEASLVHAIDSATAQVERIATVAIDNAIARLEDAVRAVHGRIGATVASIHSKVAEVVAVMNCLAAETTAALALNVEPVKVPTNPAQIAVTPDPTTKDSDGADKSNDPAIDLLANANQDVAAVQPDHEPVAVESAAADASQATRDATPTVAVEAESADQTMARVLLGGERHREEMARDDRRPLPDITTTKGKRKPRGKRGQADADTGAAG